MDFSHLSNQEKEILLNVMEQKQMKDFFKMYTNLVDQCFNDCVNGFTSSALSIKEDSCLAKCVDKYLKHTERVSLRFAEQSVQLQQPSPSPSSSSTEL